jgi:hypothetical protein
MKQVYYWIEHFLWLHKQMIKHFLLGDFEGSYEAWIWLKIHCKYKSKRIKMKLPYLQRDILVGFDGDYGYEKWEKENLYPEEVKDKNTNPPTLPILFLGILIGLIIGFFIGKLV